MGKADDVLRELIGFHGKRVARDVLGDLRRGMGQAPVDEALGRELSAPAIQPQDTASVRDRLGLTQAELGQLVGVSTAAVGAWERGRSVPRGSNAEMLDQIKGMTREQVDERRGRKAVEGAAGGNTGSGALSSEAIREIRQKAGMSQKELATALGLSSNTIPSWETAATSPRAGSVEKLLAMRG